jgi:hypothetical protein
MIGGAAIRGIRSRVEYRSEIAACGSPAKTVQRPMPLSLATTTLRKEEEPIRRSQ